MLAVSFVALQYELFLEVSFIVVYLWQCCLFLCSMGYVWQCHLSLCKYAVSGSAFCCFAVMLAASSVLLYYVGYVWWCHLLLCNVGCFGRCHLLLCNVGYIVLCLVVLFIAVKCGLFSGSVICCCAI